MKIAILTEYYPSDDSPGSGVYVHCRAAGYRRTGHEVRVYIVDPGAKSSSERDGVSVSTGDAQTLKQEIASFQPSVLAVHTPHPSASHTRLATSLTPPIVLWIHGFEAMITAFHGYHRGTARLLSVPYDLRKLWRLRATLSRAAGVIFVSDWIRRAAERGTVFRHPLTRVIPNPVDLERFRPAAHEASSARPRGLVLRPLNWSHGADVAVAAFAGLEEAELTIIGSGPDASRLRDMIRRLQAPVKLEERSVPHHEVPGLLTSFDFFVSPERKTPTQGVAMCEAMACGLPVIAVRSGGVPEYVRDGVDGFLVRPGDVSALKRAVTTLAGDAGRARAMGRNAREHVASTCSAEKVMAAELEILAMVAE